MTGALPFPEFVVKSKVWVSVLCLVASVAPLRQRPKILGIFGIINAFSAGVGPVLAGYFAGELMELMGTPAGEPNLMPAPKQTQSPGGYASYLPCPYL